MPIKLRITLFFVLLVATILALLCSSIYYFSYKARIADVKVRLTDRAVTMGQLLSQSRTFDTAIVKKINTSTKLPLINKTLDVYDENNHKLYSYDDVEGDSLTITNDILNKARANGSHYFIVHDKEAIALNYHDNNYNAVIIASGYDNEGVANLHKLLWILCLNFFGALIIIVAAGYFFSKSLLKPVKKIADEVNDISVQNLTRRIKTDNSNDEWSYLSGTLNELLNRLQESFEIQSRFISNASHELSNPLSAISSQLEIALQRQRQTDEYEKVIQSVYQDVLHLNKLVQTLLEFAKASGTARGIEINLVRIDEVLLKLKSEISKSNSEYSVILDFKELPEDEESLLVFGNEQLLFTAINNIVSNACKYSQNKTANVILEIKNQEISVTIIDNGRGIQPEDMPNIFQPFFRSDSSKSSPGIGLGLTLAHRIIKLHKGNIKVSSTVGEGTVFVVVLPAAQKITGLH